MNITAPIEKLDEHTLILRQHIASATMGDDEFSVTLSGGAFIFETPKAKYAVKIEDLLRDIIKMEQREMI